MKGSQDLNERITRKGSGRIRRNQRNFKANQPTDRPKLGCDPRQDEDREQVDEAHEDKDGPGDKEHHLLEDLGRTKDVLFVPVVLPQV